MIQHLFTRFGIALCAVTRIPATKEPLTPYPATGQRCSECNAVRRNIPKPRKGENILEQRRVPTSPDLGRVVPAELM